MKRTNLTLLASLLLAVFTAGSAFGADPITIIGDNFDITGVGTGFTLGQGVNTGINPPTTRLNPTPSTSLRYMQTFTSKAANQYLIATNQLQILRDPGSTGYSGRFTVSADGTTPYDFSTVLGTRWATPDNFATYDIKISMRNDSTTAARFSLGWSTAETDVGGFDFGVQVYRAASGDTKYTIGKRIDIGSSGLAADISDVMTSSGVNVSNYANILIRVTDAGPESGVMGHSRIQVSRNNGTSWIYDTQGDAALPNGFKFDGLARIVDFDIAGNLSASVYYDNFSIISSNAPPPPPERVWTGGSAVDANWSLPENWGGLAPVSGDMLVFNGTTRQNNNNNISDLTVPSVTFNNGGFTLGGNSFTTTYGISNLAGINVLGTDLTWGGVGDKFWTVANGSELVSSNTTTVEVDGFFRLNGGGTLRQKGAVNVGQLGGVTSHLFYVNDGLHLLDGCTYTAVGGYRIGSLATAAGGATTVISNSSLLHFTSTVVGGTLRVGDSANPVTSRLFIDNSTLRSDVARLCIPYAVGATGEVVQVAGSLVACPQISFCDLGTSKGTYTIANGTLETLVIQSTNNNGNASIYFDNALLRAASGASTAFMSGLDYAEIQAGGLTVEAQTDVTIGQKLEGVGGLTKTGYASLKLTGDNDYSGNTLVNEGKLVLRTGRTYKAPIQVATSTELAVLRQTAAGTLKSGGLTLANGSTLSFDFASFSNPTAAPLTATNLTVNGSVGLSVANGLLLATGQFVLLDYEGTIGGTGLGFDSFVLLNNLPFGVTAELVNNTTNTSIDLLITGVPGFIWSGAVDSDWDYSKENWTNQQTALPAAFVAGNVADFRDGAVTGLVNIMPVNITASTIVVSNDTLPYVWANSYAITAALMKKNGPGSVTRVDPPSSGDSITTLELNNGSYVVSNATDAIFSSVLKDTTAGTGTFVKRGAGMLTISAGNANDSYKGKTMIQEGIVFLGNTHALGDTNATIIITNGGTLEIDGHQPKQPVIVSGGGVNGQGAIVDSDSADDVEENFLDVTLAGDTTFGCPAAAGRWDIRMKRITGTGWPGLKGNGHKLNKVGAGMVSIAIERDWGAATPNWALNLGDILISQGNLAFAGPVDLGNPSASLTVNSGAILQLYDLGITNPIARNITMTSARINASAAATHTNVLSGAVELTGANTIWCNQAHLIVNGPMGGSGSLGLFANDPGTLLLNGINTYTGGTFVTNGTFGGTGVLAGKLVMLGGTNAPGADGVGTLTVNGDVTLAGTTRMELNSALSPKSDRIVVGGTLEFGGTLQVTLGAGAPPLKPGDVYQLFSRGSSSPFAVIDLPKELPSGETWDTSQLLSHGVIKVTGSAATTIGSVSLGEDGSTFTFSGTGGNPGDPYRVVSSPDVEALLSTWVPVATNQFDSLGNFNFTTNVSSGPKAFFRVVAP